MDKTQLEARRQAAEDKFNELTKQMEDQQVELNRYQGEYRVLTELIDGLEEPIVTEEVEETK